MPLARSESDESFGSVRLRRSSSAISNRSQLPSPGTARADGVATQGTALTFYQRTLDSNPDWPGVKNFFSSISAQAAYRTHSVEELRAIDYALSGSKRAAYRTTNARDPANEDAVFAAISSMSEYNDVSHEEIRLADYWYHPADAGLLSANALPTFGDSPKEAPKYLEVQDFNGTDHAYHHKHDSQSPNEKDETADNPSPKDDSITQEEPKDESAQHVSNDETNVAASPTVEETNSSPPKPPIETIPTKTTTTSPYELRAPPPPPPVPMPPRSAGGVSLVEPSSPTTTCPEETSPSTTTKKATNQQYDDDDEPTSLLAQLQEMMRQAQKIKKGNADSQLANLRETAQLFNRSLGLRVEKKEGAVSGSSKRVSKRKEKKQKDAPTFERKFTDREAKPIVESDDESVPNLRNQRRFPSAMALPDSPSSAAISESEFREKVDSVPDLELPHSNINRHAEVDDAPSMPSLESMKLASVAGRSDREGYSTSEAESEDKAVTKDIQFENQDMASTRGSTQGEDADDDTEVAETKDTTKPSTVLERSKPSRQHSDMDVASNKSLTDEKKNKSTGSGSLQRTKTLKSVSKSRSRRQQDADAADEKKQKEKRMDKFLEDAAEVVRTESQKVVKKKENAAASGSSLTRTKSSRKPRSEKAASPAQRPPLARERPRAPPGSGAIARAVPTVPDTNTDSTPTAALPPAPVQVQPPLQSLAHSASHASIRRPPVAPVPTNSVRKTSSMSRIVRTDPKPVSSALPPRALPTVPHSAKPALTATLVPVPAPAPGTQLARSVSKSVEDVVPKKKAKRARDDESAFTAPSGTTDGVGEGASEADSVQASLFNTAPSRPAFTKPFVMQPLEIGAGSKTASNPFRSNLFFGITSNPVTASVSTSTHNNPFATPVSDKLNLFSSLQAPKTFAPQSHDAAAAPSEMFRSLDLTPAPSSMGDRDRASRAKSFPAIGSNVEIEQVQTRLRPTSSGNMFSSAFQMFEDRTSGTSASSGASLPSLVPNTSAFGMSESQSRDHVHVAQPPVRSTSHNSSGSSQVSWSRRAALQPPPPPRTQPLEPSAFYRSVEESSNEIDDTPQMNQVLDSWRRTEAQPQAEKSGVPSKFKEFHAEPHYINREFNELAARKKSAPELGSASNVPAYRSAENLGLPLMAPSNSTTENIAEALHGPSGQGLSTSKSLPAIEHSRRRNEALAALDPGSTLTESTVSSPPSEQKEPISEPPPVAAQVEPVPPNPVLPPMVKNSSIPMPPREPVEEEEEPISARSIVSTGDKKDPVSFRDIESVAIADRETSPDVGGLDTIRKPAPLPPYATDGGDNKSNDGYDSEFSGSAEYEDCRDEISISLKGSANNDPSFWQKAISSAKSRAEAAEINAIEKQKEAKSRRTVDSDNFSTSGRDEFQDAEEGDESASKLGERRSLVSDTIQKRMSVFQNMESFDTESPTKDTEKPNPRSVLLPRPPAVIANSTESDAENSSANSSSKHWANRFFSQKKKDIEPPPYAPPPQRPPSRSSGAKAPEYERERQPSRNRSKNFDAEYQPSRQTRAHTSDSLGLQSHNSPSSYMDERADSTPPNPYSSKGSSRRKVETSLPPPPPPPPPFKPLPSDGFSSEVTALNPRALGNGKVTSKKSERAGNVRKTASSSEHKPVKSKSSKPSKTRSSATAGSEAKKSRRATETRATRERERISFPTSSGDETIDLQEPRSMERMHVKPRKSKSKRDEKKIPDGVRKRMEALGSLSPEEERAHRRSSTRGREAKRGDADGQRDRSNRGRKGKGSAFGDSKKRYGLAYPLRTQSDFGEPQKRNDSALGMIDERADTDLPAHGDLKVNGVFDEDRASSSLAVLPVAGADKQLSLTRRRSLPSRQSSDLHESKDHKPDETKAQRTHTMLAALWGGKEENYGVFKSNRRASTDLDEERAKRFSSLGAGNPGRRNVDDSSSDLNNTGGLFGGVRRLFSRRLRRKERERAGISGGNSGRTHERASIAGVPEDRNPRGSMTRGSTRGSTGMRGSVPTGRSSLVGRREARRSKSEHKNNRRGRSTALFKSQ